MDSRKRSDGAPKSDPAAEALVAGTHGDPFAVLGLHKIIGGWALRTFQPGAASVDVLDAGGKVHEQARQIHAGGLFEARFDQRPASYRLRVTWSDASVQVIDDPYRFPPILGQVDIHLWAEGRHQRPWEKFGAHPMTVEGVAGVGFVVWAPNARRASVVGDFNQWDGRRHPMRLRYEAGCWELFVPGLEPGTAYKFEFLGPDGALLPQKADPFGFQAELRPATASIVAKPDTYAWGDADWMATRQQRHRLDAPMSVYEVHLGSWRRDGEGFPNYRELAEALVPYVTELGFTHVELMPVSEYPFDGSWGYQPIGLYAPTSRYGTPDDFQYFVDHLHRAGIGVIVDYVGAHFPSDAHGLAYFDGTHLYEHADPRQGFHPDWNSLIYNLERNEVVNFLLGSALFWGERFHIDGLRVDAVASMLYLDYSRKAGEWIPNRYGGRENLASIDFLKRLNELWYEREPGGMTAAEESTAWPAVSRPTYLGGLGFGFKWNMGWMHDTLSYMGRDPIHRGWHQNEMTFGLLYAFTENFILPLSHDEVVHGKGSLITRMPGDGWQKFANLRAYFGFMWGHPGKKLLFMGGEFAQGREWNHDIGLDWHLLEHPWHQGVQRLVGDLNRLLTAEPALHRLDMDPAGFEWVEASDSANSVFAFVRRGGEGAEPLLVVCNFTPTVQYEYRIGVPEPGRWVEALNTDSEWYGGSNVHNGGGSVSQAVEAQGRPHSIGLTLPPLATLILKRAP